MMRSPCHECQYVSQDKHHDPCLSCRDRERYAVSLGSMGSSVPIWATDYGRNMAAPIIRLPAAGTLQGWDVQGRPQTKKKSDTRGEKYISRHECPRCHSTLRYKSSGQCVTCRVLKSRREAEELRNEEKESLELIKTI